MKKSLAIIALSFFILFAVYSVIELVMPLPFGNTSIEFEIRRGTPFRQVVDELAQKGLVRDKWTFLVLGRVTGIDRRIKAGYYPLWGSMSPAQIFNTIKLGKIIEFEITVVPGDSLREIEEKFIVSTGTDMADFQRITTDRAFLDSLDVDAPSLEGYLFPDTYRFPKGLEVREALAIMVNRLREEYDAEMMSRILDLDISEREMLTMASIVEKEAVVDSERPVISAVYFNRLKRNMPLQADPTAVYGVKGSQEKISKNDLLRKTPYNTYVIKGLPPGPIASPSLKSITAALNPADVPFLYFVSNNDGTHNFSVTLGEHDEAVRTYRNKKRARPEG